MDETGPTAALVFYDDAYVEPGAGGQRAETATTEQAGSPPSGLYGRHVAGKEFLDAYLAHGRWTSLVAVYSPRSAQLLKQVWQTHPVSRAPGRSLQMINEADFHKAFFPAPPASLIHLPCPPVARYAWARQHGGPGVFALSGVTHTLCPASLVRDLCELVTAPFESYDALICTSRAAVTMVRSVTGAYSDYLRDRFGGTPGLRPSLPVIPLGVNPETFHPSRPEERAAQRHALRIADDELAILFVGRLSFHGKAHPFPMFQGIAEAVRTTGKKAHLILSGWTGNTSVKNAFVEGGRVFAPGVRVSIVDGTQPPTRLGVWHAADLFTSLSDNLQETFGLTVIEAMASGLPVIASDWDGYRDLVVPGETGLLIPTYMFAGATAEVTLRAVFGEIGYDRLLAETNQTIAVDLPAATAAYSRLFADPELCRRMGTAGRQRALDLFTWSSVVAAYESLWRDQEKERRAHQQKLGSSPRTGNGPAIYPAPEESFAGWPTRWLTDSDCLETASAAHSLVGQVSTLPLTNYMEASRAPDLRALTAVLDAAGSPRKVAALCDLLAQTGIGPIPARATLAWMLKYGLLRVAQSDSSVMS